MAPQDTRQQVRKTGIRVGIVVPLYNEEEAVSRFHPQLCRVIDSLPYQFHIYYVNDGSSDATQAVTEEIARSDPRVEAIELSRNYGQQAALTAGMDAAVEDVVITLDGDGQHPPELIEEMLRLYESGYDIVLTQRLDTQQVSFLKRATSSIFYRLINLLGDTHVIPGSADFRLLSRQVVEALRKMPEYHRFLRGMISWVGYRSVILPYEPTQRLAGKSKYSMRKMLRLAIDAMFSFSLVPLRIGISVGVFFLFLALLEMIYVLNFWVRGQQSSLAPGWSSLMFVILIVGGMLMINLGFTGMYIGFIYQEVKRRPVYLVRTSHGVTAPDDTHVSSEKSDSEERPKIQLQ
jgi:polyisoprenyl-phosphate glycosyltransferase